MARLLIDQGADISASGESGMTPLHRVSEGEYKAVSLMLTAGLRIGHTGCSPMGSHRSVPSGAGFPGVSSVQSG